MESAIKLKLHRAAHRAQIAKTLEGEKRSAIINIAKTKVPKIKPNCTADKT